MSFQFMYPLVGRLDRNRRTLGLVRISIHAPLAGCDEIALDHLQSTDIISIHAPLAGCDCASFLHARDWADFNPRPPCGVRQQSCFSGGTTSEFQSTPPLRGATLCHAAYFCKGWISIHAPLAGCDPWPYPRSQCPRHFNPRTPCGVRQQPMMPQPARAQFQSTHPLRGATSKCGGMLPHKGFQSTHPLRGATSFLPSYGMVAAFQSTHPLRGATV